MEGRMGYRNTLIVVADDCPATQGTVPTGRGGRKTIAVHHYELITERPYGRTQEDVLFETWLRQQSDPPSTDADIDRLREQFFATPRACLRASPLPKKFGWGLHYDAEGRIALYGVDSKEYQRLATGENGLTILKALRSGRQ